MLGLAVALAACAGSEPLPADPTGRLFARGLAEIGELYITPVSTRKLAFAGAAQLSMLDRNVSVSETPGPESGTEIVLNYAGREIAADASPRGQDPNAWGEWLGRLITEAKRTSPPLAKLPDDKIEEAVFDGITGALDRFSRYAPPDAARDQRAMRDGFGGIGVTLDLGTEGFLVAQVTPGTPADLAGIRPGDRIVAIDGKPTAGHDEDEVVHQLRGPISSPVRVSLERPNGSRRELVLHRTLIVVPTVTTSRDGAIAILRVASFNQNTTQQIVESLSQLRGTPGGLRGVVLDLRGDPGGLLDQAVSLADVFIAKGPIVATVGRHPASRQLFEASGDSLAPHLPIVVLIDGGSASAAEIVAAALQDAGRAVVVGSASYGKGTVQTVLRLPNDGELTLTWAQLVTPSGYLLNQHGVVPTLCTSDLGNDESSIQIAVQRAGATAPVSPLSYRPRKELDEPDWSRLRRACPGRRGDHPIDLIVAKRLLNDPILYSAATHIMTLAGPPASGPVAAAPVTP
ncbi:MAG TPA: S41 family peptidase [Stellaceae bacterium]